MWVCTCAYIACVMCVCSHARVYCLWTGLGGERVCVRVCVAHRRCALTPALSPSSLPVISLLHPSAAGPKAARRKQSGIPFVSCLSSTGLAGRWGEGCQPCSSLLSPPLKQWRTLPVGVEAGGGPRLPPHSQLLAPPARLMEKAPVAMRKIFHWSNPIPHKKNLPHIIHIFQCNYPQPTHTAWRIKT